MTPILRVENLTKQYENVTALSDVNLEIQKGMIFGLLGPNGAGKTSLIRILTGITLPDTGRFTLDYTENKDFDTLSRMIGYLPEERGLYPDMKVAEQLEFIGEIKGLSLKECRAKIAQYSDRLGTADWMNKKARELSKGMQQMVQFQATIFYEPSLLILDEPFTGLDPINTNKMKSEIKELQKSGTTIIFSTHRMEQVEEICEEIALINKGKIILSGHLSEVKRRFKKNIYQVEYEGQFEMRNANSEMSADLGFEIVEYIDDTCVDNKSLYPLSHTSYPFKKILVKDKDPHSTANALLKKLITQVEVHSFVEILPSLNEIFIEQVSAQYPVASDQKNLDTPALDATGNLALATGNSQEGEND